MKKKLELIIAAGFGDTVAEEYFGTNESIEFTANDVYGDLINGQRNEISESDLEVIKKYFPLAEGKFYYEEIIETIECQICDEEGIERDNLTDYLVSLAGDIADDTDECEREDYL